MIEHHVRRTTPVVHLVALGFIALLFWCLHFVPLQPFPWLAAFQWQLGQHWRRRGFVDSNNDLFWATFVRQPGHLKSKKGVSFRRFVDIFPSTPSASASIHFDPSSACQDRDQFGDDNCHFAWGTTVKGNYTIRLGQPLEADDYMDGHLKFDDTLHYHFKCPVCGQDCNLQLPVIKTNITIPMDAECPVKDRPRTIHINKTLWKYSPSDGLITTTVEGTIYIIEGKTGNVLVEFRLEGAIR